MKSYLILLVLLLAVYTGCCQAQAVIPGHAHNDYEHREPLLGALENGFLSVEVDVHLLQGELYVAHDPPQELDPTQTLENLYLKPLLEHILKNKGAVYARQQGPFYLMIDFKTDAEATYIALKSVLTAYRPILTIIDEGEVMNGPVHLFISGERPVNTVLKEKFHLAGLDGRPNELGKGIPATLMPVVSEHYANYLSWQGDGEIDVAELQKLRELIRESHSQHKKVRLWGGPDHPTVWEFLLEQGVDLINTDRIEEFHTFYAAYMDN